MNLNYFRRFASVTPTITSGVAYAAGNQIGASGLLLSGVCEGSAHITMLQSIVVIDLSSQKSAIDFLFWKSKAPGITSTDKTAFTCANSDLTSFFLGSVSIGASNYVTAASQAMATLSALNLPVLSKGDTNNPDGKGIFVTAVCRGTPTYTSTTALQFNFMFQ